MTVTSLTEALRSRQLIGEAVGIMMERHSIDEHAAFRPGPVPRSGRPRTIPVTTDLVEVFRRYATERELDPRADHCDYVLVNRHGPSRSRPMSYSNAKQMVEAAGRRAGLRARPHTAGNTVPVTDPPCRQVVRRWDLGVWSCAGVPVSAHYGWFRWLRLSADACRERTPAIAAAAMVPAVGAPMKVMAARLSHVLSAPRLN